MKQFVKQFIAIGVLVMMGGSAVGVSAQEIKTMEGDQLEQIQQDDKEKEKYIVIDVRSEEEYKEGHVKHAINIPIDGFKDQLSMLEEYKEFPIITVCNSGKKSGEAAKILTENGFKDVTNAKGVKEFDGYDLVKFETLLKEDFKKGTEDEKAQYVDVREEKDFKKGAFKGAINVSVDDVEGALKKMPEDKSIPIYVYCYSGNRSAVIADALAEEGYENVYNAFYGTKEFEEYPIEEAA